MNKELVTLLRDAFGQLGVGVEYAMSALSSYYWAQAWATLVLWAVWLGLLVWWGRATVRLAVKEHSSPSGYRYCTQPPDWATEVVFNTVLFVVVALVTAVVGSIVMSSAVAALVSPDGYVLNKLLTAAVQ